MVILGLARVFFSLESILVFLGVKNYFNHFIIIIIIIVPKNVYESSIGMLLYEPHVQAQSISPCMVKSPGPKAKSGPSANSWPISDGNDNALGEIAYQAPFDDNCKFQDSHISHK